MPCNTNSGSLGVLFEGHYGTITVPSAFADLTISNQRDVTYVDKTVENGAVTVFADIRLREQALVYATKVTDILNIVRFFDQDGTELSRCALQVQRTIPDTLIWNEMRVGECFLPDTILSTLPPKTVTTVDLQKRVFEVGAGPTNILEALPVSRRQIEITTKDVGRASVIWMGEDTGSGTLKGLCPIRVIAR